ncbi:uncharacterized protein MYCFIDRAFT_80045 [Pseudocercospora fijiensis CIRAD86]|uniref:Uncharacterized protein n=1 Tax=Pseudocercospora fijiensis (strain CIRAD86) TaxID=383855 RepID=N1Q7K4_PSEFD|nr:uncharacterized protein MYCFIDRAFT_80045 [Pseudocercospora fijiensis CIRAD86]EME88664.1 hypothetical protein MYCFIDRAFT_80045 [Pseudocercospora fijiensis CIRAD86]
MLYSFIGSIAPLYSEDAYRARIELLEKRILALQTTWLGDQLMDDKILCDRLYARQAGGATQAEYDWFVRRIQFQHAYLVRRFFARLYPDPDSRKFSRRGEALNRLDKMEFGHAPDDIGTADLRLFLNWHHWQKEAEKLKVLLSMDYDTAREMPHAIWREYKAARQAARQLYGHEMKCMGD